MPTLSDPQAQEIARAYGFDVEPQPSQENRQASNREALAQMLLEIAPVTGDASAMRDAWKSSGEGAQALTEGDLSGALGDYGNMALALTGALPFLPNVGTFAGKMARTADKEALARAQDMEGQGVDPAEIWRETGWGRGVDGQWRFEIDDRPARLRGNRGSLGQSFEHPELYDAYPQLRGYSFDREGLSPGTRGTFHGASIKVKPGPGAKSTTLHETQHAVQDAEGLARGGPFEETPAMPPLTGIRARRFQQAIDIASAAKYHDMTIDNYVAFRRAIADDPNDPLPFTDVSGRPIDAQSIELAKDRDALDELWRQSQLGTQRGTYKSLAGEVEARNVETRSGYTPEQRRATPPWETEDIPREQQVVRGRNPELLGKDMDSIDPQMLIEGLKRRKGNQ